MNHCKALIGAISMASLISATANSAETTGYPSRPVTLVVGYAAGGATDTVARLIAQRVGADLGQTVIVENRAGANGNIATDYVARAKPDGYTVLFGGSNNVTNIALYQKLPFDFAKQFEPVAMAVSLPNILVVHPSVPAKSVKELIDLAKKEPGRLNFGTSGIGSSQHLAGAQFQKMAGVSVTHVPYTGSAPAVTNLLGGSIQMMFDNAPSALANIQAKKIRALGVTSRNRVSCAPDIPPIAESGLEGYDVTAWLGFFVPVGTPKEVGTRWNEAVNKVLSDASVRKRLVEMCVEPMYGNVSEVSQFVKSEIPKWAEIVKNADAKLE